MASTLLCPLPIYSEKDTLPDVLRIRTGLLLDELVKAELAAHIFLTTSKASCLPQCPAAFVPTKGQLLDLSTGAASLPPGRNWLGGIPAHLLNALAKPLHR